MIEATYKPTLRPETSLSDLERALSRDFVSLQDMALSYRLDLTLLYCIYGSIGEKKEIPRAMESI
jgi:hypothetical protein